MLKIIEVIIKGKEYLFLIQDLLNKIEKYIPAGTQISWIIKFQDYIDKIQLALDIVEKYIDMIPTGLSEQELPEDIKALIAKFDE